MSHLSSQLPTRHVEAETSFQPETSSEESTTYKEQDGIYVRILESMGFSKIQAQEALKGSNGDFDKAVNHLTSSSSNPSSKKDPAFGGSAINKRLHQTAENNLEVLPEHPMEQERQPQAITYRQLRGAGRTLDYAVDDEEETIVFEDSEQPGAFNIQGTRRGGMPTSLLVDDGTITYSMGGEPNSSQQNSSGNDHVTPANSVDDLNLVVAELAPEPPQIVEGTPMNMEDNRKAEEEQQKKNIRNAFLLGAVLFIVAGVGMALLLTLGVFSPNDGDALPPTIQPSPSPPSTINNQETSTPSFPPTTSASPTTMTPTTTPSERPTISAAPTQNFTEIAITMLSTHMTNFPNSQIQRDALEWLVDNDDGLLEIQDDGRLLDRLVLAIFFFATNGPAWSNTEGWLSNESVCNWHATSNSCGAAGGRVDRISLVENNLRGTLPTEIGLLTELTFISLWGNNIDGTIPREIGNLLLLEHFDMFSNILLGGRLPTSLFSLTALTQLNLSTNSLSDTIPTQIGNLSDLTYLSFWTNTLRGTMPTEMGHLTALQVLSLSRNTFDGTIPTEFGNMSALRALQLTRNDVTGNLPTHLGQLSALEGIYLAHNNLSGDIPNELALFLGSLSGTCRLGCNDGLLGVPSTCRNC